MTGSSSPERCATTTGTTMATETAASGTLRAKAHRLQAATGTAVRARSAADDGWVIAATRPNASEKNGRTRRRSSASNQPRPDPPATRRLYCAASDATSSSGRSRALRPGMDSPASCQSPTMASASISTSQRGSRNPLTTMKPEAGRISPKTSPCTLATTARREQHPRGTRAFAPRHEASRRTREALRR